jgi:predicted MPP superfamily phosphohydrolase
VNRRSFIATLVPTPLAASWFRYGEPNWFEITRTRIRIPGIRPTRILHISDIHISDGMTASDLAPGFHSGLAAKPDLICLTGDFVSYTRGFDRDGLHRLLRMAAGAAPTYAVMGNHDGGAWLARFCGSRSSEFIRDLVSKAGVRLLHNQSATQNGITVAGVADMWSGEMNPALAFAAQQPGPAIVLCHNPDGKESLAAHTWDLMLSGHTHGGQARIPVPGFRAPWAPVADKRFVAGLYAWNGRQLFITRGIGSPMHLRAFCRPEVSILDLV